VARVKALTLSRFIPRRARSAPKIHRGETLYVFRSIEDPTLYGFSFDMIGHDFPDRYGSWEYLGIELAAESAMGTMAPEVAAIIERDGYAVVANPTAGEIWPMAPA
jgi:hypothetical protein